ncbi:MAG TPA: alkaline phosphatase family protein [Anaerolineaceae bacterium]|nr:alkaline phosphatase family protein [Longilinea sp.]HNZ14281.1 alkaline phosphatase family protein [Anaerolineaceae bacterium]HOG79109.1 alkaline phosphatase family protein [Anaerolineaceae bacterium]HQN43615.1 alkaline phosphatase family protein [Anaerolineaceae bacterium]
MPDLTSQLLPQLEARRLNGLDASPTAVYPAYQGQSLVNLPGTICKLLGAEPLGAPALAPEWLEPLGERYQHVVMLLVDGLGLQYFQRFLDTAPWKDWLNEAALLPLTSVTPSTTATALTTLWTGATPAEHGILGYEMWLKEYGMVSNMILHCGMTSAGDVGGLRRSGFDPLTFLPVPTLGGHLKAQEVKVSAFTHQSIAYSGLSQMLHRDAELMAYKTLNDLWVTLSDWLDTHADERTYTYVYWGDIDELSHRYSPDDIRPALEFATFAFTLRSFVQQRQMTSHHDTLMLMTADHGQIHTPRQEAFDLRNHPKFTACLTMGPTGENRLPYLFLRSGMEAQAEDYIQKTWPGMFRVFPTETILQSGLMGDDIYALTPQRMGDRVVVPQDHAYWWWANKDNPLQGRHGGLTAQEMLVPLFALPL